MNPRMELEGELEVMEDGGTKNQGAKARNSWVGNAERARRHAAQKDWDEGWALFCSLTHDKDPCNPSACLGDAVFVCSIKSLCAVTVSAVHTWLTTVVSVSSFTCARRFYRTRRLRRPVTMSDLRRLSETAGGQGNTAFYLTHIDLNT